ncbi:MAG: DUF3298 domain-containing protein [Candidimonas sp.]|nr:MAG: DUF3298 domain-containing protein [Candidimonas sp.]TAM26165.1 MAG: DUF3298 domain-containing protein [Candidimonas sp.]TAM81328.1 MAG: DUF3298 domain-containing protein [Candidimonas sp.]
MKYSALTLRPAAILFMLSLLSACASGPRNNISLIPGDQIAAQTRKEGLFTQPIKWQHQKPGCKGECPTIKLDSIAFPGLTKLTELVDHALATMTGTSTKGVQPYDSIAGYQDYFWKTAAPRDSTLLSAKTRYRNKNLTVIELNTWQYFTGAAHGISATQFLNWDNNRHIVLALEQILQPGKLPGYVAVLRAAHKKWLAGNADARRDPQTYNRLWPFQVSENFAFTDHGLVVKYDTYQIAPYYFGQPELLLPYSALRDILQPQYLPAPA